jgi:periplasmic mercuric ion binding protein
MNIKNFIKTSFFALLLVVSAEAFAQKTVETSFKVDGICQMCEARIEKAVDVKGVKSADYDLDSHTLTIAYSPKQITEDQIHHILNEVGHDTEKSTCSDEQYDRLHGCCKYRAHENH